VALRVLVVDDSPVMRNILRAYLVGLDLEFEFAGSGEEALSKLAAAPADLLVTDVVMPGMDGLELARRARALSGPKRPLRVLLISGQKTLVESDFLRDGTAEAFLAKPVDPDKLRALITTLASARPVRPDATPPSPAAGGRIRVLVADDTEVGRTILARIINADPSLLLVGLARDGGEAVEMAVREHPQIVLLDALMPGLDGLAATRRIMERAPTRVVIFTEHESARATTAAFEATRAGALEVLARPRFGDPTGPEATAFRETLKMLAEVPVIRRVARAPDGVRRSTTTRPPPPRSAAAGAPVVSVVRRGAVAICTSTGGPAALAKLLPAIAPVLDRAAVLLVQHLRAGFDVALVDWLRAISGLPVTLAQEGTPLLPGAVLFAPDGHHLVAASRDRASLLDSAPLRGHRPSGTPLFESVGRAFGTAAVGVILTGMGDDGVEGLRALREAGGIVLAQSPDSCVVPGMPGAAIAHGLPHAVLPLEELAAEILARLPA
jgi:two-component system chemotaxis response regulator CheB